MRIFKKALLIAAILTIILGVWSQASPLRSKNQYASQTYAVDGDTLNVGTKTVRLVGIDTPESKRPGVPVECGALQASKFMKNYIYGKKVVISKTFGFDQYGRTLGYVSADGKDVGLAAIKAGWATEYVYSGTSYPKQKTYHKAFVEAKKKNLGVHKKCDSNFHSSK